MDLWIRKRRTVYIYIFVFENCSNEIEEYDPGLKNSIHFD